MSDMVYERGQLIGAMAALGLLKNAVYRIEGFDAESFEKDVQHVMKVVHSRTDFAKGTADAINNVVQQLLKESKVMFLE